MNLSIIIVNWNTVKLLAQCLESIYASSQNSDFEVLVVDNASTDTSVQVTPLENEVNVGSVGLTQNNHIWMVRF